MAKFGEGDARWIVQKREDGTNVNAWHWVEKDCMAWSKKRLAQLFDGAVLVDSPRIVSTGLDSLSGEVFLNNRKAKLVASYEVKITLGWRGTAADGTEATGMVELPYVADENDDEDTEVKVLTVDDSGAAAELRNAILRSGGREAVRKLVQTFVDELKAGVPLKGGAGDGDDSAAPGATEAAARSSGADGAKAAASPATAAPAAAAAAANGASAAAGGSTKAGSSSRARLELEQRFYCRPSDLYECFTVEGRVCAFTQSPATVDARPGGSFSWFNGSVQGTFTALAPPSRIEMEWRFSNWAEGCTSKVVIMLEEPDTGNTVLRLVQTGIPEEDAYGNHDVKLQVERGWEGQVLSRIRQVFGFGA